MSASIPIKRINHLELIVGNARQAAYYYGNALGFDQIAYLGPETGYRDRASYALRQGDIHVVLTSPLHHEDRMNIFLTLHGDSVKDIAFEVEDTDTVYREVIERGAESAAEPHDLSDEHGTVRQAAVRTYGNTIHTFISKKNYDGPFLPGFVEDEKTGPNAGLVRIDHVVGNVEDRQMDRWAEWYIKVFGFYQFVSYDDKDISTEFSALRSKVVASADKVILLPINEPAPARRKSQIQEYIDFHVLPGVQHVALSTNDIIESVAHLRDLGLEFLHVPAAYYDTIWDRVGEIDEDREKIRKQNILVDRDEKGYLLQIFTRPVEDRPTLFYEVIQRKGSESFGKGNFKALFEAIEREQARRGNL